MRVLKQMLQKMNQSRGQGVVEYGLILIITILTAIVIVQTKTSTEDVLKDSVSRNGTRSENPTTIVSPNTPASSDVWDHGSSVVNEGYKLKPTAYFSIPNPIFVGEKIHYWDTSYDADGQIVERSWEGKVESFPSEGEYTISLTVKDNDDLMDTYTLKVKVVARESYTKLIYDHKNEDRSILNESDVRNDGSSVTRILDHIYGERADLYGKKHVVIEKNYYETVQNRVKDITYLVKVPIIEVTYDGQGREISREPYTIDGEVQFMEQTETKIVSQPAEYKTEWKDNNWTYYVYNEISSVQNPSNSWGSRSPGVDYPRFDPEEKVTRQNPWWESSRTTQKKNQYNAGSTATSTPCPTCTIPNEFSRKSTGQSQTNTLYCGGYGVSRTTHTRTYNYIDHSAYDYIYKYTGKAGDVGNLSSEKKLRNSWTTQGWKADEQVGGSVSTRPKYTSCEGDGWSESCWQRESSSANPVDSWSQYDTNVSTQTRTIQRYSYTEWYQECKTVNGKQTCEWKSRDIMQNVDQERKVYTYYYKRKEYSCTWYGTAQTSSSYSWGYTTSTYDTGWYDISFG